MRGNPDESLPAPLDEDPERAVEELRRSLERAHEQVRTFRRVLLPDTDHDA